MSTSQQSLNLVTYQTLSCSRLNNCRVFQNKTNTWQVFFFFIEMSQKSAPYKLVLCRGEYSVICCYFLNGFQSVSTNFNLNPIVNIKIFEYQFVFIKKSLTTFLVLVFIILKNYLTGCYYNVWYIPMLWKSKGYRFLGIFVLLEI